MFTEKDELRHPPNEELEWQESYYLDFYDPKTTFACSCRIGLEENQNKANMNFAMHRGGKLVYNRHRFDLPLPKSDWTDMTLADLTFKLIEPQKKIQVLFNDGKTQVDLAFDAITPLFALGVILPENVAGDKQVDGHVEQLGKLKGYIVLEGEKVEIDTDAMVFRDHSWGVRKWQEFKEWRSIYGKVGDGIFFMAAYFYPTEGPEGGQAFIYNAKDNSQTAWNVVEFNYERATHNLLKAEVTIENEAGDRMKIIGEDILPPQPIPYDRNIDYRTIVRKVTLGDQTGLGGIDNNLKLGRY